MASKIQRTPPTAVLGLEMGVTDQTSTKDPTDLTAQFVLSLLSQLAERKGRVPTRELAAALVRLLNERERGAGLRFSYSPYSSLSEFLRALTATGAVALARDEGGQPFVQLTEHGKRLVKANGNLTELRRELGFTRKI